MAWRCEVKTARGWTVVDEWRDIEGEKALSRAAYERSLRRSMPILSQREYRVTSFDAPRIREMFTLSVSVGL